MFLFTCILSGCDYLKSIEGIDFKKAHRLVKEFCIDYKEIFKEIRREGNYNIPLNYETEF